MDKIIISKQENKMILYIYNNDELIEQYEEYDEKPRLEGNIYLGEVKDIVVGMQSAFLNIGEGKNALIHVKDLIPKTSLVTGNINTNLEEYDIKQMIKPNQKIIVQIKRDCNDDKGPRVTKDIKLIGKYVVIMPFSKFITASQKIEDSKLKNKLIDLCKKYLPDGYGAIIRTAAIAATEQDISDDITKLHSQWKSIVRKSNVAIKNNNVPLKLYDNNGILGKIIIDLAPLGIEIYTNSDEIKKRILKIDPSLQVTVKEVNDSIEIKRKIWLKCGGFITIDTTEALTAIDVNSGKFIGKNNLENTVLKVNLEATNEIAKQIRLRDTGGIIVVDYIDMEKEEDRIKVREEMEKCTKEDRSKVQVLEFTKLGLLEMTRKHILGR